MNLSSTQLFTSLNVAFDYFNFSLFKGQLPAVMFGLARLKGVFRFFPPDHSNSFNGQSTIGVNRNLISDSPMLHVMQALVQEMNHLWQLNLGTSSRNAYHNKEWAHNLLRLGLIPTNNGKEGGKITGQTMYSLIAQDGLFLQEFLSLHKHEYFASMTKASKTALSKNFKEMTFRDLTGEGFILDSHTKSKNELKRRFKYTCQCPANVWGKSDLHLICRNCNTDFKQELYS